jgi:hypothetical protein
VSKHDKTLAAIFADPTRANIKWHDIEAMLLHFGARVYEGSGSRVRVEFNGHIATFHRPHPQPDAKRGLVRSVREFPSDAGIIP